MGPSISPGTTETMRLSKLSIIFCNLDINLHLFPGCAFTSTKRHRILALLKLVSLKHYYKEFRGFLMFSGGIERNYWREMG